MNRLARLLLAALLTWQVALKVLVQVRPLMSLLLVLLVVPVQLLPAPASPRGQHRRPEGGQLGGWTRHPGSCTRQLLVAERRSRAPRQWLAPCVPAAAAALALLLPLHPPPQLLLMLLQPPPLLPPPLKLLLLFRRCSQVLQQPAAAALVPPAWAAESAPEAKTVSRSGGC